MINRQGFEEKSRLGRLLVSRGYLSNSQLEEGLQVQRETGQRLGEVFIQHGWITERELHKVLKHQARFRRAAALVTVAVLPFQPMVSFAASNQSAGDQGSSDAGQMVNNDNFQPMTEQELSSVSGQGNEALFEGFAQVGSMPASALGEGRADASDPDAVESLELVSNVFVPVLNFLDSEMTVSGVHYREDTPRFAIRSDGGLEMAMPERIEQIRMENIRVGSGPSMGNVTISDVRFHAGSSMTIYAR